MTEKKTIAVVGAGPAGLAAATEAARLGATVYLLSDGALGGRAGWHSLVPSKVALHTATAQAGRWLDSKGMLQMSEQILTVAGLRFNAHQQALVGLGVRIIPAKARFTGPNALVFPGPEGDMPLAFDSTIIAAGSVPRFPPGLRPDGEHILAPRFVSSMQQLPESLIVIGGGVTGAEYAWSFLTMGLEVTWLVDEHGVLPGMDRALVDPLLARMHAAGLVLEHGVAVAKVAPDEFWPNWVVAVLQDGRRFEAEKAFLAVGRRPDVSALDLPALGLAPAEAGSAAGGIQVDPLCRTALPHVFAAGDVTGSPMIANKAEAQGLLAARAAMGVAAVAPNPHGWVQAVYTSPQLAQVGLSPERAVDEGRAVRVLTTDYLDSLERLVHGVQQRDKGFFNLVLDEKSEQVLGASAFGQQAAELMAPVAMALELGLDRAQLARVHTAYPSLLQIPFQTARLG